MNGLNYLSIDDPILGGRPGDPASVVRAFNAARTMFRGQRKRLDIPYPCRLHFPTTSPDTPWVVGQTLLLDVGGMRLTGDGAGLSVIEATGDFRGDIVQVAIPAAPIANGVEQAMTPDHWPSTVGVFDSSVGQTIGFRTKADAHLAFQGTPFDTAWADMGPFTLEFCLIVPNGILPQGTFFGMGSVERGPIPLHIDSPSQGYYRAELACSDGKAMSMTFPAPTGQVHRIVIFGDPTTGQLVCWNAQDLSFLKTTNPLSTDPSRRFLRNDRFPFLVGGYGEQYTMSGNAGPQFRGGNTDFTLAGLSLTRGAKYDPSSATLKRSDGKPVNDKNRYFDAFSPGVAAVLQFDTPASVVDSTYTIVAVHHGGSWDRSTGRALLSNLIASGKGGFVKDCQVRDLEIRHVSATGPSFGAAVGVGLASGLKILQCHLRGGHAGYAARNVLSSYKTDMVDVRLSGSHAGFTTYGAIVDIERAEFVGPSDHCGVLSGEITIRDSFAHDGTASRSAFQVQANSYASETKLYNFRHDGEANPPGFFIEAELPPGKMPCTVVVSDCLAARVAKSVLKLTAGGTDPNNWTPGVVATERFRLQNPAPGPDIIDPPGMWTVKA